MLMKIHEKLTDTSVSFTSIIKKMATNQNRECLAHIFFDRPPASPAGHVSHAGVYFQYIASIPSICHRE